MSEEGLWRPKKGYGAANGLTYARRQMDLKEVAVAGHLCDDARHPRTSAAFVLRSVAKGLAMDSRHS